ncbi:MAG: NAD-dependent epimerase/dehydratase family protein [Saprospiraceae bacterium]|nr:NAD-dependent epimerase/dehydratase family protein [Saprospiraceae bacterium]
MSLPSKILITGASGFVGTQLIEYLESLNKYHLILHSRSKHQKNSKHQVLSGDLIESLSSMENLKDVDCVIHLAGCVSYNSSMKNQLYEDNVLLTRALVNLCIDQGIKKLIFLSSASTLTRSSDPLLISENAIGRPVFHSYYAKTKYLAELEVFRAIEEGMKCVILNPCIILGEGDWNRSSLQVLQKIANGLKFYPVGSIGLIDVRKVVQAIHYAIETERSGLKHLLWQKNIIYKNFIEKACKILNINAPNIKLKYNISKILARFEPIKSYLTRSKNIITNETAFLSAQSFTYCIQNPIPGLILDDLNEEELIRRSIKQNI